MQSKIAPNLPKQPSNNTTPPPPILQQDKLLLQTTTTTITTIWTVQLTWIWLNKCTILVLKATKHQIALLIKDKKPIRTTCFKTTQVIRFNNSKTREQNKKIIKNLVHINLKLAKQSKSTVSSQSTQIMQQPTIKTTTKTTTTIIILISKMWAKLFLPMTIIILKLLIWVRLLFTNHSKVFLLQ